MFACGYGCAGSSRAQGYQIFPGGGVRGSCEPSYVDNVNRTQNL